MTQKLDDYLVTLRRGLEAIEAVCTQEPFALTEVLEILTGLVDKSLVVKSDNGGIARFGQLETVRPKWRPFSGGTPSGAWPW